MGSATSTGAAKALCLRLMRADTEAEAIAVLTDAGYWNDRRAWRLFSDDENAFAVIGNQQAEAVAAFVEKIVNSVDARLVNACRMSGCDPESPAAPSSMREAVARFFEGRANPKLADGRIAEWARDKATAEGRLLTVAATGRMPPGQLSLTVADQGEGQTPDTFPDTFMSIQRNTSSASRSSKEGSTWAARVLFSSASCSSSCRAGTRRFLTAALPDEIGNGVSRSCDVNPRARVRRVRRGNGRTREAKWCVGHQARSARGSAPPPLCR
jgi:hypothetical protein